MTTRRPVSKGSFSEPYSTFMIEDDFLIDRNDYFNQIFKNMTLRWEQHRLWGKAVFLVAVSYLVLEYALLSSHPSAVLILYSVFLPLLLIVRTCLYIINKSFLFLFDNCYFVNTALLVFIWIDFPVNTYFLSIFAAVNGPVLWAVLPFRNTLAFHDIDKITSCYIHWAPTLVTWVIRWFPARTSIGWIRKFASEDVNVIPVYKWHDGSEWFWLIGVPMAFLVIHDLLYIFIVHIIIKPNEEYADSFTYQRSKDNLISNCIKALPLWLQLSCYAMLSFTLYILGILISVLCYRMFLIHTVLLALQLAVMIWNGGCYYLDYFAYLALKANDTSEELRKSMKINT